MSVIRGLIVAYLALTGANAHGYDHELAPYFERTDQIFYTAKAASFEIRHLHSVSEQYCRDRNDECFSFVLMTLRASQTIDMVVEMNDCSIGRPCFTKPGMKYMLALASELDEFRSRIEDLPQTLVYGFTAWDYQVLTRASLSLDLFLTNFTFPVTGDSLGSIREPY